MTTHGQNFAPAGLVADVLGSAGRIVQGEIALLRAEGRQRAQSAQAAIVVGVIAACLGMTALNVLAGAAIAGVVAMGLAPHWATLVVGLALLGTAAITARSALAALRMAAGGPVRVLAQMTQDLETLQTMVKQNGPA